VPKFTVNLETYASEDVTVEASTPHEAFKAALDGIAAMSRSGVALRWKATSAEGEDGRLYNVVGACEGCGQALLEDEWAERIGAPWRTDEEGIQTHDGECPKPEPAPSGPVSPGEA
jgi:hypothetical protein